MYGRPLLGMGTERFRLHRSGLLRGAAEILTKPGRLSIDELRLIKEHSQAGYDAIRAVEFGVPRRRSWSSVTSASTGPDTRRACVVYDADAVDVCLRLVESGLVFSTPQE